LGEFAGSGNARGSLDGKVEFEALEQEFEFVLRLGV